VPPSRFTLRVFGAGGAFSRRYGTTCSLLELRSGARWLIDCGRQAPDQLWRDGRSWHALAGQIVTHVHGDHIFGLEDFAFMRYYDRADGVEAVIRGGPRPGFIAHSAVEAEVWESLGPSLRYVKGPDGNPRSGTLEHYFEVVRASSHEPPRANPWRHAERFETPDLVLTARESEHVPGKPSCSLEIDLFPHQADDRIAWWSGDCTVDGPFLTAIEPRTSIYFHDCTFTDYVGQVHGSFSLLERLPERVRRKMVLMHHEDNILDNQTRAEELGFRLAMPGQVWDLESGNRIA
jgi:ribonuclease BN (tRNA processing enzyme)